MTPRDKIHNLKIQLLQIFLEVLETYSDQPELNDFLEKMEIDVCSAICWIDEIRRRSEFNKKR